MTNSDAAVQPKVSSVGASSGNKDPRAGFVVLGGDLGYLVRFRSDLLKRLSRNGYRVRVFTPDIDEASVASLEALGVEHVKIELSRTGTNPLEDARSLFKLFRKFRDDKPTAVFAYGAKPIAVGIAAAVLAGVPRLYAMLAGLGYAFVEGGETSLKRNIVRVMQLGSYRLLLSRCRSVIFHNRDDRNLLVSKGVVASNQTVVVSGSGIDLVAFPASEAPVAPVRFLFVGRLLRSKGVVELLEAASILQRDCPEVEVHLAGASDTNPESVSPAELNAYSGRSNVIFHGQVADVRPLLASSSVFVLPSYREGLPRSGLEALATGRTVVVADVPGCREIVEQGVFGELVPVRDPVALARSMRRLAQDPERIVREGRAARLAAEERFSLTAVTDQMIEALER
ncbi:MAG: glycosyltransferase family 4 protein [Trueperaceae bacterium]|nr:glycosyltransferase family 4 protein [Trueperaceae bacterium]MCC6309879.1 glycosyltransferase family 4 protein [Trueperaceae bacterium]MCW5818324.1 glycosyltransferase family 4 protein [Trueperaceae bacterium]